jgi:hypothetical protein
MTRLEDLLARKTEQRNISDLMRTPRTVPRPNILNPDDLESRSFKISPPGGNYPNQKFTQVLGPDNLPFNF